MTFLKRVYCFLKTMFVHISLSLRVIISRCNDEKSGKTTEDLSGKEEIK